MGGYYYYVRSRAKGFTLIEVLVALVIITVSLAALVMQSGRHVANAGGLHDRTLAHWVALNQITKQQLSGEYPGASTRKGSTEMGQQEWHWRLVVTETEDDSVRRMDVEVRVEPKDKRALVSLIAYLPRPSL